MAAPSMTTREAITAVAKQIKEELVFCTTGFTCRDMQAAKDRPENFYTIGSMGLAASIALGVALVKKQKTVVVFDGDGAVQMGLGNLVTIGALKPKNLIHVVFDNEVFASTGNQPTYSDKVPLDALASASGYALVVRAETAEAVAPAWQKARAHAGPAFLLIKCRPDVGKPMERVRLEPEAITAQFMKAVNS
jgi:thiamine pyrophosphate-dependent acetolactate synthase large subunit-like protein